MVYEKQLIKKWGIRLIILMILGGLFWWSNTSAYSRALKKANKENEKKIDSIQLTKKPLKDSIEIVKDLVKVKDEKIKVLISQEDQLRNKLNSAKYENSRLKNNYNSSDINQRVKLWAKLTTEENSTSAENNKLPR